MSSYLYSMYCLQKIGKLVHSEGSCTDNKFQYKRNSFINLYKLDFNLLLADVHVNKDFCLQLVSNTEENEQYLGLFLRPEKQLVLPIELLESRRRLISVGFDLPENTLTTLINRLQDNCFQEKCTLTEATTKLYEELLVRRQSNDISGFNMKGQNVLLKPILRPYQTQAVNWLLYQELNKSTISTPYIQISCDEVPYNFYLDTRTLEIYDYQPKDIILPTGGILADEMGLGKTLEIIDLILCNKKPEPQIQCNNIPDITPPIKRIKINEIHCICPKKHRGKVVECTQCRRIQHKKCVRKFSRELHKETDYICPDCWKQYPVVKGGSTIIISPPAIKMQWLSEVRKHVSEPLSIFVYNGVSSKGWISPMELVEYDIVLTDYNVLKREINLTANSDCNLRNSQKYMRMPSPLLLVEWWRVCLDEAQMVESSATKGAQMARLLPAIHRWAVTGTPIQKSIEDIRGILEFLNCYPFCEKNTWNILQTLYFSGDTKPLLDVLSKVLWRTCKKHVLVEIGIPPQTEELHYVTMSDVEKLFYATERETSFLNFLQKKRSYNVSSTAISNIDTRTLKIILEPFRKLRQTCTTPVLFQKFQESYVKKVLQPRELLTYLKTTNENECKAQLRTIASSFNGLAGLLYIQGDFDKAINMYGRVLKIAKEHTGTICVDTLLQIHALHNLIEANAAKCISLDNEFIRDYISERDRLEWKYIEKYYTDYKKVDDVYKTTNKLLEEKSNILGKRAQLWYGEIFKMCEINNLGDQLVTNINDERKDNFSLMILEQFISLQGINYFITTWFDKLKATRLTVLKHFEDIRNFTENIKPNNQLNENKKKVLTGFIKKIFDCHLVDVTEKPKNEEKRTLCILCKTKKVLLNYECMLFYKTINEQSETAEGSWRSTFQETIFKIIYSFAKNKFLKTNTLQEGEVFLQIIENLKKEYKELNKLWIEVEYTVKAYDELDMCKMRLRLIEPEDVTEPSDRLIYNIPRDEIDLNFQDLQIQLQTAEKEFARKCAKMNYLKHLEHNYEPNVCPICHQMPDVQYVVLDCGHHICMLCCPRLIDKHRREVSCVICRAKQPSDQLHVVSMKALNAGPDDIVVNGDYASKIQEIVRTVLLLKRENPEVKIIIFSQWEPILKVIGNSFTENEVSFALKPNIKAIENFKDPDLKITALLLLLAQGSKGLNLIEASHVFLVEPILNLGEELQAINRVHRIGQTKSTTIHRFIVQNTIEENIFKTISNDETGRWLKKEITLDNISVLFNDQPSEK